MPCGKNKGKINPFEKSYICAMNDRIVLGAIIFFTAVLIAIFFGKLNKYSITGLILIAVPYCHIFLVEDQISDTLRNWYTLFIGTGMILLFGLLSDKGKTIPELLFGTKLKNQ